MVFGHLVLLISLKHFKQSKGNQQSTEYQSRTDQYEKKQSFDFQIECYPYLSSAL